MAGENGTCFSPINIFSLMLCTTSTNTIVRQTIIKHLAIQCSMKLCKVTYVYISSKRKRSNAIIFIISILNINWVQNCQNYKLWISQEMLLMICKARTVYI